MFASAGLKALLSAFKANDYCDVRIFPVCESKNSDGTSSGMVISREMVTSSEEGCNISMRSQHSNSVVHVRSCRHASAEELVWALEAF
jgi:hypothetical protein